ncbi:dATP/dGTP pyrophosphohydrolase domain-containing protein [Klebsiella pneumoniae]
MTKSTITRERIQRIMRAINSEAYDEEEIREWLSSDEIMELSRMALAAMDGEPVAWTDAEELSDLKRDGYAAMLSLARKDCECADPRRQILLFTHPAPSRQRDQVRQEHSEWSQATFGNVSPVGPLKHLSKEALEAAAEPGDLSEWADMQFLLWDAQRRAGITDDQITQAMIDKLAVNKQREWPEPKDGEPRLHIKEQPAPVVPEEMTPEMMRSVQLNSELGAYAASNLSGAYDLFAEFWKEACRAAMLAAAPQSPGSEPATVPGKWIPVSEQMPPSRHEVLVGRWWGEKPRWCCKWATYIPGHPDAQSSGWLIPGASWTPTHWMPLPAAPQEVKDGK